MTLIMLYRGKIVENLEMAGKIMVRHLNINSYVNSTQLPDKIVSLFSDYHALYVH